jgi:hypothetical protein
MSSVRPQEQGIASGANNALREVGGALGIAVMSSIFSAQGGYGTAQTFVDGLRPALVVGSAMVALAGVAALLIPTARHAARTRVVGSESPQDQGQAQEQGQDQGEDEDQAPVLETASR